MNGTTTSFYALGYRHGNTGKPCFPPFWDTQLTQSYLEGYAEGEQDRLKNFPEIA